MTATRTLPKGWMGRDSLKWHARHAAKAKRIIEVGAWLGRSTTVLAKHTKGTVWAVDHWEGTPWDASQHALYADVVTKRDVYAEFRKNLGHYIRIGKVVPVRAMSVAAASQLLAQHGRVFDFVFIDADHSYEGCREDIAAYLPLLKSGGLISGHDYHWAGVKQAVDEAFGDKVQFAPGSIWGLRI